MMKTISFIMNSGITFVFSLAYTNIQYVPRYRPLKPELIDNRNLAAFHFAQINPFSNQTKKKERKKKAKFGKLTFSMNNISKCELNPFQET